ncbi:MAG: short-chain fatty acyl-CoA regulator family protein [Myxococcota bacterium]
MTDAPRLGGRIRALRRQQNMSQAALAAALGISPSYLNLIEANRRPLTAQLLIKLAQHFKVDLASFAPEEDQRLVGELMEVFGDPLFESHPVTNVDVRELASSSPAAARSILTLYRAYQGARESADTLAHRVSDRDELSGVGARLPSEEVTDFIQAHMNHFPELESAADALVGEAVRNREDLYRGLVRFLEEVHGIRVYQARADTDATVLRRYDPGARTLTLSELLAPRSRNFQLAHQIALLTHRRLLDQLVDDPHLTTEESRALGRVALANYFAGAVLMPYQQFLDACHDVRYDVQLLGHRFRTSFEQVCHRLTTLRRPGAEGVPFHLIRIDIAGNISKRFSASGIRFARFSGACPKWNVFAAFLTPGLIRLQISRMPDGAMYFCLARTLNKEGGGYHSQPAVHAIGMGCPVAYADKLVYSDGLDLSRLDTAVPVGVTCRVCERTECEQRAFPSMRQPLRVDENQRGISFYAPTKKESVPG